MHPVDCGLQRCVHKTAIRIWIAHVILLCLLLSVRSHHANKGTPRQRKCQADAHAHQGKRIRKCVCHFTTVELGGAYVRCTIARLTRVARESFWSDAMPGSPSCSITNGWPSCGLLLSIHRKRRENGLNEPGENFYWDTYGSLPYFRDDVLCHMLSPIRR